ncbi:hypothetical protein NDU88_006172 [Pleurodeles waltl]|uniref:Uncharacterized protein n=1 Tax=Pleurodeles waltl TaxID=8319 RepID=A0AAV7RKR4_PLEWA|nr:hypothetical protein NDU88_006172 [Pleurodeles waltl]
MRHPRVHYVDIASSVQSMRPAEAPGSIEPVNGRIEYWFLSYDGFLYANSIENAVLPNVQETDVRIKMLTVPINPADINMTEGEI